MAYTPTPQLLQEIYDLLAAGQPAGDAIIGKVGFDQTTPGTTNGVVVNSGSLTSQGHTASVSLTRTADTAAYLANDVIGINAAGSPGAAALTFASMGVSAGDILITSAQLEVGLAAVISGMTSFRLYLYSVTPPSALLDNAPWDLPSGDRASFLGYVDLGTPVDLGSTLYVETNNINKHCKLAGTSLFAYLVTAGPYTPSSADVFKITLHTTDL